ncbi:hypothetical protein GCM10011332_32630 [Terasakiella brassicae]|uniref:Uncharacterized protein n=1 Tax=Terasakiella brassicae TaxID=1634917 RepID=A0A917FEL0_9PROT|nr:hypothetical protein [Terasakiella brassicae]GGF76124.1 hypothetical protein GCM10011332_32630 [Terasakiella brassicae]
MTLSKDEVVIYVDLLAHAQFSIEPNPSSIQDPELLKTMKALALGIRADNCLQILKAIGESSFQKFFIVKPQSHDLQVNTEKLWDTVNNFNEYKELRDLHNRMPS